MSRLEHLFDGPVPRVTRTVRAEAPTDERSRMLQAQYELGPGVAQDSPAFTFAVRAAIVWLVQLVFGVLDGDSLGADVNLTLWTLLFLFVTVRCPARHQVELLEHAVFGLTLAYLCLAVMSTPRESIGSMHLPRGIPRLALVGACLATAGAFWLVHLRGDIASWSIAARRALAVFVFTMGAAAVVALG